MAFNCSRVVIHRAQVALPGHGWERIDALMPSISHPAPCPARAPTDAARVGAESDYGKTSRSSRGSSTSTRGDRREPDSSDPAPPPLRPCRFTIPYLSPDFPDEEPE